MTVTPTSGWAVATFRAMGCEVRLAMRDAATPPRRRLHRARCLVRRLDRAWSRFARDSELSRLNRDPRWEVPVSAELALAIRRALAAARASGGLVDPTLAGALVALGYDRTFTELEPPAGAPAGAPRPAAPAREAAWRSVAVLDGGVVRRRPGVLLDLGGIGKGLAADLVVAQHADAEHVVASIGGDVATGGRLADDLVQRVLVAAPTGDGVLGELALRRGGAATSGVTRRAWRTALGPAHHLLDPASGRPARTGVVQVTALGTDGCDAERRAKQALLGGPAGLGRALGLGGVAVLASGEIRRVEVAR